MLIGTFFPTLDSKNRVNFPVRLREDLGERFVLCRGLDGCLFVYPMTEWKALEERINALPLSKARQLQRFFFSGALEVEPDQQGRIVIPAHLCEHAGLKKELLVAGVSTRAEIWDLERWKHNEEELTFDTMLETMDQIGF